MGEIYRMDLETGSYSAIPNTHILSPIAIDYNPTTKLVYYSDVREGVIRSTTIDGATQVDLLQLGRRKYTNLIES